MINPDLTVSRIDPRSNRIVARVGKVRAENIATGDGDVWITEGNTVTEIDSATNAVARRLTLDAGFLVDLAIGGGAVWATDPERWQRVARRHRSATRGASRPARDVGGRSRLRRGRGVGDERDHR